MSRLYDTRVITHEILENLYSLKEKNTAFMYYKNLLTWLIRIYKGYQGVYPIKHGVY
jgi:hypothetical protein